jgi:N-acetyl-gamma-glutamyl-phosphate reductase
MKIGVIGASGYSGGELLRLLVNHPEFELHYIAAGSSAGSPITQLHPGLRELSGRAFEPTSTDRMNECELLFFALPHGESAKLLTDVKDDVKVVDLGADYRLSSKIAWERYYGGEHAGTWSYGLSELPGARELISRSTRVANPGCYATSIIVAAAPFVAAGVINSTDIVAVAASGTTGAGRKPSARLLASEVMGSLTSYKFGGVHQHTPEIEQALASVAHEGSEVRISFTPILAPMPRGILSTITAVLSPEISLKQARGLFTAFYQGHEFINLLPEAELPQTAAVVGSNSVHVQCAIDARTGRLIISSALDNLGKGAASAAIQNANLMSGFESGLGLSRNGLGA